MKNTVEAKDRCKEQSPNLQWYCSFKSGHSGAHGAYPAHDLDLSATETWTTVPTPAPARVESLADHLSKPHEFWHGVAKAVADTALRWAAENPEAPKDRPSENAWRELAAALGAGDHPAALAEIRRLQAVEKQKAPPPPVAVLRIERDELMCERDELRRLVLKYRESRLQEKIDKAATWSSLAVEQEKIRNAEQTTRIARKALFANVKE